MRWFYHWLVPALLLVPTGAQASDEWRYAGTLYLWAAGINGETAGGADIDVDFDTVLDHLDMGFMGAVEVRRGPWSAVADVVYLNVGADKGATVEVPVAPDFVVTADVEAGLKVRGWAVKLFGAYTVFESERGSVDLLAGARYLELKGAFDLRLSAGGEPLAAGRSVLETVWDGVIGVKGQVRLDDHWYLPYYADVGTGESDLTWQLFGGVGYAFDWGEVSLLYRHVDWQFGADHGLDNLSFSGPAAAVTWRF